MDKHEFRLSLGSVCMKLCGCTPPVSRYLSERCPEYISPDSGVNLVLNVTCIEGTLPLGNAAPPLETSSHDGTVEAQFGESSLTLSRSGERGTMKIDSRLMPVSMENCIRVAFAAALGWRGEILLHAAGILRNGAVHIFFGPSEAGKSTISSLKGGGLALSDEAMLLCMRDGIAYAQGTPFWGEICGGESSASLFPVAGLYLLCKSGEIRLERMRASLAAAQILANAHSASPDSISARLLEETAATVAEKVPCFTLHFTRDEGFWRMIDALGK